MLSFTRQTIFGPLPPEDRFAELQRNHSLGYCMKLVRNTGSERVIDFLRTSLTAEQELDVVTSAFSVFAFAEMRSEVEFQPEWK